MIEAKIAMKQNTTAANSINFDWSSRSNSSSVYFSKYEFSDSIFSNSSSTKITRFSSSGCSDRNTNTCSLLVLIANEKIKPFRSVGSRLYPSCWEQSNLNLHGLITKKYFLPIFFKLRFFLMNSNSVIRA